MWIAKVKINGEKTVIGSKCRESGVQFYGYPCQGVFKEDKYLVYFVGFIFGEEKQIKEFIKGLKKDKRIVKVERKGNFIIGQTEEPLAHKSAYHYEFVHVRPIIMMEDGTEFWTLGSWNKKSLSSFVNLLEKKFSGELLSMKPETLNNFSILDVNPDLTKSQKKAVDIAIKNGYYEYPRKIGLEELANIMGISYSTFQAHLRKAEKKIVPSLFNHNRDFSLKKS